MSRRASFGVLLTFLSSVHSIRRHYDALTPLKPCPIGGFSVTYTFSTRARSSIYRWPSTLFRAVRKQPQALHPRYNHTGAGDENRTHMASLEGWGSTIELRPLIEGEQQTGTGRTPSALDRKHPPFVAPTGSPIAAFYIPQPCGNASKKQKSKRLPITLSARTHCALIKRANKAAAAGFETRPQDDGAPVRRYPRTRGWRGSVGSDGSAGAEVARAFMARASARSQRQRDGDDRNGSY